MHASSRACEVTKACDSPNSVQIFSVSRSSDCEAARSRCITFLKRLCRYGFGASLAKAAIASTTDCDRRESSPTFLVPFLVLSSTSIISEASDFLVLEPWIVSRSLNKAGRIFVDASARTSTSCFSLVPSANSASSGSPCSNCRSHTSVARIRSPPQMIF